MSARLFERLGAWALMPDKELIAELQESAPAMLAASNCARPQAFCPRAGNARRPQDPDHPFLLPARAGAVSDRGRHPRALSRAGRTRQRRTDGGRAQRGVGARRRGESALGEAVAVLATRARRPALCRNAGFGRGRNRSKLRAVLAQHNGDERLLFAKLRETLGVPLGEDPDAVIARFCEEIGEERVQCQRAVTWLLGGSAETRNAAGTSRGHSSMLAWVRTDSES